MCVLARIIIYGKEFFRKSSESGSETNVAQCEIIIKNSSKQEEKNLLYLVDTFTEDGLANADSEVAV